MCTKYMFLLFFIVMLCREAVAVNYTNAINESAWRVDTSVFECKLEHQVPYYGNVIFTTRAGEASKFYLKALSSRFAAGKVELISRPPVWQNVGEAMTIAMVDTKQGKRPLWLGSTKTELMLSELSKGQEIALVNKTWYDQEQSRRMQVVISSIGFREVYLRYLSCLVGLLPANFDQLRRTALYFPPGNKEKGKELDRAARRKLDQVLQLTKHDKKVKRFYVDGHTSSAGDRTDNLELSKARAEAVTAYLTAGGIPQDAIVTRWHGERYPVASNESSSGRAKNRRVTLRLERVEDKDEMPMAANK